MYPDKPSHVLEDSTERDKRPVGKTGDNSGGMDRPRDHKSRQKAAQRKGSKRVESEKAICNTQAVRTSSCLFGDELSSVATVTIQ